MKWFLVFFLSLIVCIPLGVQANERTIDLENRFSAFLDFKLHPRLFRYWKEGSFQLSFSGSSPIFLKEKNEVLGFYIPLSQYSWSGVLSLSLWEKKLSLPYSYTLPEKNPLDYDIFSDMFDLHLQERSLSCEIAATRDILSTLLGKDISEDTLLKILPKSSFYNKLPETPWIYALWGNPEEWFVGLIDDTTTTLAKQKLMTGYGVYEAPIQKVVTAYGLKSSILNKKMHHDTFWAQEQLTLLLTELEKGNMVQLWGDWCTHPLYDDGILPSKKDITLEQARQKISAKNGCYNWNSERELIWNYYDTQGNLMQHIGLDGEHAFILLGWKGDKENPTHIRVWDTDTGYHMYPTGEWMRKWEKMDYRSLIIQEN